jgi:anti-sigma-K factor RskA
VSGQGRTDANNQIDRDGSVETEHVSTLLAAYALDALDPEETAHVARHLSSCPDCRIELAGYTAAVSALPYASDPRPVPLRARAGLLRRIDTFGADRARRGGLVMLPPTPLAANAPPPRRLDRVRHLRRAWLAIVPAAVLVVAFGVNAIFMQGRINDQQHQIQALEADKGKVAQVVVVDNASRYVSELSGTSTAPQAAARLFLDRDTNNGVLLAINLQRPAAGSAYVAWLHGRGAWERLGVLTLDTLGRSQMNITPQHSIDNYDSFVVTLESDPTIVSPAGPVILNGVTVPQSRHGGELALVP